LAAVKINHQKNLTVLFKRELLELLKVKPEVSVFPYSMITAKPFKDERANVILAPYSNDPYWLIVDRYSFMLFWKN
jgi:hypothetical protein